MLKKRKNSVIAFIVVTVLCLNSVFALWTVNEETVLASDATRVEDVTFEMKTGASVRYATTAAESGLRFAATMPKADYEALQASGYADLSFGILIMPYNYIDYYGPLTVENVFGDSAIYDWATLDENGKWVYSGTKTRIINLASDNMAVDKDNADLYVVNGSITAIMENNLARDYVGVGYIQYKENANDEYSYRFAEYTDNNARSIVEVSEAVYEDSAVSDENKALVKEYYIDATDVRCVKFFDGDDILEIHKTFTEYYFDGEPLMDAEAGYDFAYWVDKDGTKVESLNDTEVTQTMKLYATCTKDGLDYVAEGYLGETGKIMTAVNDFLAMDVTKANVALAQEKYEEVIDMLSVPRASEYNELISTDIREAINAKVAAINAVLEDADDLYETYSGVISEATNTSCAQEVVTTIPFPCLNYSLLQSVSFEWSTTGWTQAGYGDHRWYYKDETALSGTAVIVNNGDGTLTVTMTETGNSLGTNSVTITDTDIINGKKPATFTAHSLVGTQTFTVGEITATSLYDFTSVEDSVVLYTGQNLIDNISASNGSGTTLSVSESTEVTNNFISNGATIDGSDYEAQNWTICMPKVNYSAYETVCMEFTGSDIWESIGFIGGGTISDGSDGAMGGTITFTNVSQSVTVVINDTAHNQSVSYTITDTEVINGTKAFTFLWNHGAKWRKLNVGPISATMSLNGRLEAAAEVGKTPKLVESTLFSGQNLIDNITVTSSDGTTAIKTASNDITDGVEIDPSSNTKSWTITLPKINYSNYQSVEMNFKSDGNMMQLFGFASANCLYDGNSKLFEGGITITNNGDGTLKGNIKAESHDTEVSATITDADVINGETSLTLYFENWSTFARITLGPITGTSRVSAENVEKISVADREALMQKPYYEVTGKVLYTGAALRESVSITSNSGVSISIGYDDTTLADAVQFDPSGNSVVETISLPKINYSECKKVTMQFKGRNGGQTFGFSSSEAICDGGDGGTTFDGTITIVTNQDGTLTGTMTDTGTGNSVTTIITDNNIVNGTSPLTLYWNSGIAYRQILIGPISCDMATSVTTSPSATPYTIVDFSKSTYEVNAVVTNDTEDPNGERDILVRRDLNDTGLLEIQTQNSSSTNTYNYAVELPWIPYNKYVSVSTTITSNNGMAGVDEALAFLDTKDDGQELKMSYANGMLTVSLGGQVSTTCTDADVLNGRKGLTIYMQGSQYTSSYLSAFTAIGKVAPTSSGTREQALDLDAKSGSTNVSAYRIAYDANGAYNDGDYYKWIANEMKLFLEEMTGETFLTVGVHDPSVIKNTSKYIVIGERLAQEKGVENFDLTQTNGYNVKQDYKNLYIYGGTPRGTMSGVYGFLKDMAGLTFYTDDVYTFVYKDLHVASGYATAFNPSFNIGITGYAEAQYSKEYHSRLGLSNDGYIGAGAKEDADGNGVKETIGTHCMLDILPYETYGSQYPGWYVQDDGEDWQLDFTNDDRDAMLKLVVASMKEAIEAFPDHDYFVFGQPDSMYGPDVAEYLDFMNDCSEAIDTWLKEENPTRTVSLCMFAYNGTLEAPTTGSFYNGECASTAVIFAPVGARYTDTFDKSYHKDTDEGEWVETKTIQQYLDEWKKLEGVNIHFWLYGTDYYNYMMPMNTITNMQANYHAAYKAGTDAIHYQFQTGAQSSVGSDWQRLKTYLSAELTKDVEANVATLQDNFMNAMYGSGAESMKTLLAAQQEYVTYDNFNKKDGWIIGSQYTENYFGVINGSTKLLSTTYFDEDTLKTWMGYIDAAKTAINNDTTLSDAKKQVLLDNVDVEALSIRYMLIELHNDTKYDDSLDAWKTAAKALGCTALNEGTNF